MSRRAARASRAAAFAGLALVLAACQSQWYLEFETTDLVTTEVVVRTQPSGAHVSFDGVRMEHKSPVRIPVEYFHTEELHSRQNNYGARMREGMSWPVATLTFPVWAVASFFHFTEETRRHVYGANRHVVAASLKGHQEANRDVVLEGEAEVLVEFELPAN